MNLFSKHDRYDSPQHLEVIKARANLIMHEPFFGNLALQMKLIETRTVQTMSVNGEWIKFNPDFVDELNPDELKGVVAHEVMHVAMMHHLRRKGREQFPWQLATDNAINHVLKDSGFSLPKGGQWEERFKGMSAEAIYKIMYDEALEKLQNEKDEEAGKECNDGDGIMDQSAPNQSNQQPQSGVQNAKAPNAAKGNAGSNEEATSENEDSENNTNETTEPDPPKQESVPDPGGYGAVEDAPDLETMTEGEKEELEKEWKDNVMSAAMSQKMHGSTPAWLEEFVDGVKEPKIHYTELLRDFIEDHAKNDYSMMHPNTRYAQVTRDHGISLPGLYSEEVGNIGFIIDTSGSISDSEKERYASEISGVLEDFPNMDIDVVYVDTRVAGVQHLANEDLPIELKFRGGGGTSYKPGFKWFEENDIEPKAVIYFTDGWCSNFPKKEPPYPVLWMCTDGEETMTTGYGAAPWGTVIGLEID